MTRRPATRPVRESFVVHVYRRGDDPGHEVAGVVESVRQGKACAFLGRDDLWAALIGAPMPGATREPVGDAEGGMGTPSQRRPK